ncbi:MAG: ribonuclease E/G, partial [Planctomycetia bacterium]|nr:ribonuclease E/G [Planctomycetia bacterium]
METVLLINTDEPEEIRVALVEDGRLEEVYVEAETDPTGKGNVYVGRVQNVEKGIGAAFVDLGGGVTGFLHVSDISADATPEATEPAGGGPRKITDLVKPGDPILVQISRGPVGHKGPTLTTRISLPGRYVVLLTNSTRSGVSRRIESGEGRDRMRSLLDGLNLPAGMAVILRTASNGRSTGEVQADLVEQFRLWENLKGRLLEGGGPRLVHEESDLVSRAVRDFLPPDATRVVCDDAHVAARIREYLERTRPTTPVVPAAAPQVEQVVAEVDDRDVGGADGPGAGDRTATGDAPGADEADGSAIDGAPGAPAVVGGPDAVAAAEPAMEGGPAEPFAALDEPAAPPQSPELASPEPPPLPPLPAVEVHPGPTPIFHAFGVEAQMEDAFRRTIRLPSGGSIVIDPTEALVAIDVNSGRMTEEEDLETTALKTNLEAVPEVARQLRLRDLGGVIVVDFIDLRERAHTHQVERAMRDALRRDRARIRLSRIGPFGCLELTRQRIRPALFSVTHVACPTCGGAGRRRHPLGLALRVLREMRARAARSRGHGGMEVRIPPPVAELLRKKRGDALSALETWLTGPFKLVPDPSIPYGGWAIKGLPPRGNAPRSDGGARAAGGGPAVT